MKETIEWLIEIEKMAGNLYRDAQGFFRKDKTLSSFLGSLAEDEAWHFRVMGSAAEYIRTHPETDQSLIVLDDSTRGRIESLFVENRRQLEEGRITKDSILSCIAVTEFSEWNDLFFYVVNSLKEQNSEFQYVAAKMQNHLKYVRDFLETRPEKTPLLAEISNLPEVWQQKILIVEDTNALLEMLEMIFHRDYITASAKNGRHGLEKLRESYFDVIISDIEMPEMNGIEFFQEAIKRDPSLASRFLFFSGYLSGPHRSVVEKHNLPFLQKPASVMDLRQKVKDILANNRQSSQESDISATLARRTFSKS